MCTNVLPRSFVCLQIRPPQTPARSCVAYLSDSAYRRVYDPADRNVVLHKALNRHSRTNWNSLCQYCDSRLFCFDTISAAHCVLSRRFSPAYSTGPCVRLQKSDRKYHHIIISSSYWHKSKIVPLHVYVCVIYLPLRSDLLDTLFSPPKWCRFETKPVCVVAAGVCCCCCCSRSGPLAVILLTVLLFVMLLMLLLLVVVVVCRRT